MSKGEIIEGNKAIELAAKFMDIKVMLWQSRYAICDKDGDLDLMECDFYEPDRNWNQLIKVVEKIEQIDNKDFSVEINLFTCLIIRNSDILLYEKEIIEGSGETCPVFCIESNEDNKINAVWQAVVEFIKWYNQNKNPK